MYEAALAIVIWIALARCAWFLVGLVRMTRVHRRARTTRWGFPELLTIAEFPLFLLVILFLHSRMPISSDPCSMAWLAALAGAFLAIGGLCISLWSFYTTYRAGIIIGAGHYVESQHTLVTHRAYGFVRHPIYLAVFLIWLGLAIAFTSLIVLLLTVLYVIPAYLLYMRSEEDMMLSEFGDEYRRYCDRVGMLLPKLRRSS